MSIQIGQFTDADLQATLNALSREQKIFFVQIGAMDGVRFDLFHPFIRKFQWQGVLVEPMPDMFAALKANYAGQAGLSFVNAAIAQQDGSIQMTRLNPEAVKAGLIEEAALGISTTRPDRGEWVNANLKPELQTVLQQYRQELTVACLTLPSLLASSHVTTLDVLIIDTEGADWDIAQQLDLSRFMPRLIYFECAHLPPAEISAALKHFMAAGYRALVDERRFNLLFIRQ